MERYGVLVGLLLVGAVTLLAIGIGRMAAASVARFRAEHHVGFGRRDDQ